MIIQAFLSGPAFNSLQYSTNNSDFTTIQTSSWYSVKDLLTAVSSALPNSWVARYDTTTDRVMFTPGSGSLKIVFGSLSMAEAFGFSATTTAFSSSNIVGDIPPKAICPIHQAHYSNPVPGRKPDLSTFRHGRSNSVSWGRGTRYGVKMIADYANADRILSGPLSVGKVRIGPYDAASIYKPTNLGGYLDGFIINQPEIESHQDEVESFVDITATVSAPHTAHNSSESVKDDFWGYTSRGYSLNHYTLIEGLPFRFCEVDTGISDSDRTVSPTLIIDNSQQVTHKIDRLKGLSGASGATLGILDPLNDLGVFSLPTFEVQIASDVAFNATSVTLSASTDSLPSSGLVFLGNECLKYTANSGSSGSPANTLSGITRPYGPGYAYGTQTIQKFKTITDKKKAWQGSTVRLFAQLLDPFGRAVDTSWEGTYSRQVGSFTLTGLPGYDQGVWVLECQDLIRRLAREVVAGTVGTVAPFEQSGVFNPTLSQASEAAYTIVDNKNATIEAEYIFQYLGIEYSTTFDIDLSALTPSKYSSLLLILDKVLNVVNATSNPSGIFMTVFGIAYLIGDISWFKVSPENIRVEESGDVVMQTVTIYDYNDLAGMPNISGRLVLRPKSGQAFPSWLPQSTRVGYFTGNASDTITEHTLDFTTGLTGSSQDFVVIMQPAKNPNALGTFPSTGLAVLGAESNEDGQLFTYSGKAAYGERTILTGIVRLEGNAISSIKEGVEVVKAEFVEGNAGEVIAKILQSSGFATGARGTFDTLPQGYGYALESSDYVNDSTSGIESITSLMGGPTSIQNVRLALTRGHSLEDIFGGILLAFGLSLAWVRVGSEIQIGAVGTLTTGQIEQYTITDSDLIAGKAAKIRQIGTSPNVVQVKQSTSMLGKGGASYTFRIVEDVAARGTQSATINLFGLDSSTFFTFAEQMAARLADGSFAQTAYEITVSGERDYLAGQLVRLDLSYPGLWDFQNQTTGLNGLGRIMEVSRNLTTNKVRLVVMVSGPSQFFSLCPVAFVTNYDPSGPTITVNDSSIFKEGETIRVEIPGQEGGLNTGKSTFTETTIDTIAGNNITLDGALTFTPSAYTVATFVQDDNASIPIRQKDHTHVGDGSRYS